MADDKNRLKDKALPEGWRKEVVQRKSGTSAGKFDTYIFSPDNVKFRSKNELATYIKQHKLAFNADDFSFARSADDVLTSCKVNEKEKAEENDEGPATRRSRGSQSATPGKALAKTPSAGGKTKRTGDVNKEAEAAKKEDDSTATTTLEKKTPAHGKRGAAQVAVSDVGESPQMPINEITTKETSSTKKGRSGRQKKSDAVVNVDENTQDYSELVQGDMPVTTTAQQSDERSLAAENTPASESTAIASLPPHGELEGLPADSSILNVSTSLAESNNPSVQGKRIRTPKLFADEVPSPEERRLSLGDASLKVAASARSSSEVEGSRKKKGGRPPKKVEQNVEDPFDPFARQRNFAPFNNFPAPTPAMKPKKIDMKKRKVDFEDDLDLIDRDPLFDTPAPKKERKSAGGRSSWGEIRHHDDRTSPIDVHKVEREAKKEKERGKYFDTVILTGSRERKKSGWTKGEWVDPESITSLQWSGPASSSGSRGYDLDELYSPRTSSGGTSSRGGRKKVASFGYDKAKEDSMLADLYNGAYGEPSSGTMPRYRPPGRKSYDADEVASGSALRMHLSQPSVLPANPSIDEMFIAEQSMKNRELAHVSRLSTTGGMYRKVGNSFLSKALGERKERTGQDDTPPCICPHPSDDHTYSSLVIRQHQQLSDPMLDDDGVEDFDLSLLHGNGDDSKMMVAPTVVSLPNGGRTHQQQQPPRQQPFVLPMRVPASLPSQQQVPVEKVAVQFMPLSSVDSGSLLPTSTVLDNSLIGQAEHYRPDDVNGTTVGESLPLVLMEDDVLERSDSTADSSRSMPLHAAASRLATASSR